MNIIFFDDESWDYLLPLTFTRPVCELRVGILKISEKWKFFFNDPQSFFTRDYLRAKFECVAGDENLLINGSVLPDKNIVKAIEDLPSRKLLINGHKIIALKLAKNETENFLITKLNRGFQLGQVPGSESSFSRIVNQGNAEFTDMNEQFPNAHNEENGHSDQTLNNYETIEYKKEISFIDRPWHIFSKNGEQIKNDFELITCNRESVRLSETNRLLKPDNIFAEEGVKAECVTINASNGPVYLGKDSEIMEGAVIRGPFALCEGATVKMAAKIYGPTTIGPSSKAGGEINNSVIQGNSNKGHDGFLGNSVLGEWCNIGADTNNSNLKNNYAEVKLWSYMEEKFIPTGLQFCGLIMGDHSKCGINTMFNTGTVVGVNANIFGAGFPRNFIPSFSWGGPQGFVTYSIPKAFETAKLVMERRGSELDEKDQSILLEIFEIEKKYRS